MNFGPKLRLREVEEAGSSRHLDGEDGRVLPGTGQHQLHAHSGNNKLDTSFRYTMGTKRILDNRCTPIQKMQSWYFEE